MLLDINGLRENYRLLMNAKIDSQGRPLGLAADTRGELFRSNSAWGWWTRVLGGLSGDRTLRIAVEKTYRALEAIPGIILELGRSGNIDERLGPLKIFPQTPEQIISSDRQHVEPFVRFVQHIRHFWVGDTSENQELVAATKKFASMSQWLPQANLVLVCRRIASEEVRSALEAYQKLHKKSEPAVSHEEEAQETLRLDLVASQESIIQEQVSLIEALKAQLAANSQTPAITDITPQSEKAEEQEEETQVAVDSFEAAIREEVKRLDQLVTKIEERKGIVQEEPPAPLTMLGNLGGKIGGGSSRHDVIEHLARLNKRLSALIDVAADWDPDKDPSQQRIAELEQEIDRLSDSLVKATEELARRDKNR